MLSSKLASLCGDCQYLTDILRVAELRFDAMCNDAIPWKSGSERRHKGEVNKWASTALNFQSHVKLQMGRYPFLKPYGDCMDIKVPFYLQDMSLRRPYPRCDDPWHGVDEGKVSGPQKYIRFSD
jgi:hypothetical protein